MWATVGTACFHKRLPFCGSHNFAQWLNPALGNTSFSHFDAPDIGLIIKNAQGFSLGSLFKNHHKHPSYNKLQRKKLYLPKPGSAKFRPLAPGLLHMCESVYSPYGICNHRGWLTRFDTMISNKYQHHINKLTDRNNIQIWFIWIIKLILIGIYRREKNGSFIIT